MSRLTEDELRQLRAKTMYNPSKHRIPAIKWIYDVLYAEGKEEAYVHTVQLFDSTITDQIVPGTVQLHAATCMFIITKLRGDRGHHIWSNELVSYSCDVFTKEQLLQHELTVLTVASARPIIKSMVYMMDE